MSPFFLPDPYTHLCLSASFPIPISPSLPPSDLSHCPPPHRPPSFPPPLSHFLVLASPTLTHARACTHANSVALALLGKKGVLPEALLELCAASIAAVAKDKHARSHMLKMGAMQVCE